MNSPTDIRQLDFNIAPRLETGPLQIGTDWPGVYFRGNDALHFGNTIEIMLKVEGQNIDPMSREVLAGFANVLMSCLRVPELQR